MVLIDADMIVTRPLARADRARPRDERGGRVRERHATASSPSGASCSSSARPRRRPLRLLGPGRARRRDGAPRCSSCSTTASTGSTSSARFYGRNDADYAFRLSRAGRAQRDPAPPRRPGRGRVALRAPAGAEPAVRRPAAALERDAALRLRGRRRALRAAPLPAQAVARADVPRHLLAAAGQAAARRRRARSALSRARRAAADAQRRARLARAQARRRRRPVGWRARRAPSASRTGAPSEPRRLLLRHRQRLLPRRGGAAQLAAPASATTSRSTCSTAAWRRSSARLLAREATVVAAPGDDAAEHAEARRPARAPGRRRWCCSTPT